MNKIEENLKAELLSVTSHRLFPQILDKLMKCCYINLIEDQNNTKLLESIKKPLNDPKEIAYIIEAFNAMLLLIIEFQRKNFQEPEIQYTLKELGLTAGQIDSFLEKHNKFLEFIINKDNENIANKFDSSINLQRLMDVEWKNLYVLSSKFLNKINKDQFLIKLKVLNEKNEIVPLEFKCRLEELTELVNSLNIACKCIENASDLKHIKF